MGLAVQQSRVRQVRHVRGSVGRKIQVLYNSVMVNWAHVAVSLELWIHPWLTGHARTLAVAVGQFIWRNLSHCPDFMTKQG